MEGYNFSYSADTSFTLHNPNNIVIGSFISHATLNTSDYLNAKNIDTFCEDEYRRWTICKQDLQFWEKTLFRAFSIRVFKFTTTHFTSDSLFMSYLHLKFNSSLDCLLSADDTELDDHHFGIQGSTEDKRAYFYLHIYGRILIEKKEIEKEIKKYIQSIQTLIITSDLYEINPLEWLKRYDPSFLKDILAIPKDPFV